MKKIIIINLLTVLSISFSVNAENTAERLAQCAQTKDSLLRLVCYDKLAAQSGVNQQDTAIEVAPVKSPTQTPPVAQVRSKQQAQVPKSDEFGATSLKRESDEIDELSLVIKSATKSLHKLWILTFENGQVWHQTDGGKTPSLKAGDTIVIKRAALGSFLLKKAGSNRTVRVRRIK